MRTPVRPPQPRPPQPRPTQAELDYVRALLLPLEQAAPLHPRRQPQRVWPPRQHVGLSDAALLAEYRKMARIDEKMAIPLRRLLNRLGAEATAPLHPSTRRTAEVYSFAQASSAALRSPRTGPQSPRTS